MENLTRLSLLMKEPWPCMEIAKMKLKHTKAIESMTVQDDMPIVRQRDTFAEGLLPSDASHFIASKTTGDGNCLFNAASIALCGNIICINIKKFS
jgi:hypothetical protein